MPSIRRARRGALTGRKVISVMRLPQIDPPFTDSTRDSCMMRPISWPRRIVRQFFPRRSARACCYYHSMDMHAVARTVIWVFRILSQVEGPLSQLDAASKSLAGAELADDLSRALLRTARLTNEEQVVACLLLAESCGIEVWRPAGERRRTYQDGRHRARALMDAGARRIVVNWTDDRDYDS